jgi:ribosomal protein S16
VARGADIYLRLNQERLSHWIKLGAQASARVKQLQELFAKTGEITGIALAVSRANRKPKHKKQTAVAAPENNAGEAA